MPQRHPSLQSRHCQERLKLKGAAAAGTYGEAVEADCSATPLVLTPRRMQVRTGRFIDNPGQNAIIPHEKSGKGAETLQARGNKSRVRCEAG